MGERNTIGYEVHDTFPSGLIRKVTKTLETLPSGECAHSYNLKCVDAGDSRRALGTNPSQMPESHL